MAGQTNQIDAGMVLFCLKYHSKVLLCLKFFKGKYLHRLFGKKIVLLTHPYEKRGGPTINYSYFWGKKGAR